MRQLGEGGRRQGHPAGARAEKVGDGGLVPEGPRQCERLVHVVQRAAALCEPAPVRQGSSRLAGPERDPGGCKPGIRIVRRHPGELFSGLQRSREIARGELQIELPSEGHGIDRSDGGQSLTEAAGTLRIVLGQGNRQGAFDHGALCREALDQLLGQTQGLVAAVGRTELVDRGQTEIHRAPWIGLERGGAFVRARGEIGTPQLAGGAGGMRQVVEIPLTGKESLEPRQRIGLRGVAGRQLRCDRAPCRQLDVDREERRLRGHCGPCPEERDQRALRVPVHSKRELLAGQAHAQGRVIGIQLQVGPQKRQAQGIGRSRRAVRLSRPEMQPAETFDGDHDHGSGQGGSSKSSSTPLLRPTLHAQCPP